MPRIYLRSECIDSPMTRTPEASSAIFLVASIPFMSGMVTSMTTTLGRSFWASRTVLRPFSASATTSIPASLSIRVLSPSRMILWSSASNTRMVPIAPVSRRAPAPREMGTPSAAEPAFFFFYTIDRGWMKWKFPLCVLGLIPSASPPFP